MSRPHFLTSALEQSTSQLALYVDGCETPIAATDDLAIDSESRRRGLLGRTEYPRDSAMIIAPCNAIHTFFMKMAIDVVFADRDGRVLKIRRAVPPWRASAALRAFAVVEFAAGSVDMLRLKLMDRLSVR